MQRVALGYHTPHSGVLHTTQGCEGETVRSCSSDIKEMVQHMSISGAGKATSAPVNESSKNINIAKITKTINKD